MKFVRFVVDNSTLVLALLTAAFGLVAAFGLELTSEQVGAVMGFAGAVIAVLTAAVTTAKRTVVALVDNSGVIRNGPASAEPTGAPAAVDRDTATGLLVPQTPVRPDLLNAA